MLDGAGWRGARALVVADSISPVLRPPNSPELNPVENVWQYLRANWLAISAFDDYEAIVGACCHAWNRFAQAARKRLLNHLTARAKISP